MPSTAGGGVREVEEISLADVVRFLLTWWKLILVCGVAGALLAWAQVKGVPATYEAQVIIAMAQVPVGAVAATTVVTTSGTASNGFVDVETPALLAERMSLPTTFSRPAVDACGLADSAELLGRLRIIAHNNATSTLRFAVKHSSPELAERCVNAVVAMIREQQAALARPVIARLEKALDGIWMPAESDSGAPLGASSVAERDSDGVRMMLAVRQLRQALAADTGTRVLAPVHAPEQALATSAKQALLSGGAAGVFLGLAVALLWALGRRFRSIAN